MQAKHVLKLVLLLLMETVIRAIIVLVAHGHPSQMMMMKRKVK